MKQALTEWESILGPSYVVVDSDTLNNVSTATFATSQRVPAVIRPESREQVQQCLRVATRFGIKVYTVSTGRNWGYGSSVPVVNGCVIMDLRRMRRIVDFNETLAYVTVEPGVTQKQLYDFLHDRRSNLWMDATGSSPECSLIGNTLERGFGHTPYGDHSNNCSNLEVVLASGEVLETGFSRAAGVQAAPIYRSGLGPQLDGLFMQSNLGVVTRMTIWLMPQPEAFQAFFFRCALDEDLPVIIDALRPLRLSGVIRSGIHLANDYRVLSGIQQYPWNETGNTTPLTRARIRSLHENLGFGAWNGSGALYGTVRQVAEARRLVRKALRHKVTKLNFLDDRLLGFASRFSSVFRLFTGMDLRKTMELVLPVYGLLRGIPTDQSLKSTYWRKRTPPPTEKDLDRDRCGLMWCAPVAPAEGRHAAVLADIASEILLRHGFEPMLSITLITERAIICVVSITYDRDIAGEDDRAKVCLQELLATFVTKGYMPYRLGIQSMGLSRPEGVQSQILDALKQHMDPVGILSLGRYERVP
jgi:4-cresol dehydrogenase (hydroxylating)